MEFEPVFDLLGLEVPDEHVGWESWVTFLGAGDVLSVFGDLDGCVLLEGST